MNISDYLKNGIQEEYVIGDKLGEGGFSTVRKGTHIASQEEVAIKIIEKELMLDLTLFEREVQIVTSLDHPSVIKIYEVFEEADCFCIVMELMQGGELMDYLADLGAISESKICSIFKPIFDSVRFCHEYSIVHRDLKPENILFTTQGVGGHLKIADFGLARLVGDQLLTTACGTPAYMAPEIVKGQPYNEAVDYWSMGVILYLMLSGKLPFEGSTVTVLEKVKNEPVDFCGANWKGISEEAKDLCKGLLDKDPSQRYGFTQVLNHPWVVNGGKYDNNLFDLGEKLHQLKLLQRMGSSKRTTASLIKIEQLKRRLDSMMMEIEDQ